MNSKPFFLSIYLLFFTNLLKAQEPMRVVTEEKMQQVYEEVKTPFKYGLVIVPEDNNHKVDCPSVFRKNNMWYMTYLIFNGRGYETWLSKSRDLLHWNSPSRILSFSSDTTAWDANQKAGYIALADTKWGGSYALKSYNKKY